MGRVYDVNGPNSRAVMGYRVFDHTGRKVPMVTRVEFDADADEGEAVVTVIAHDADGGMLVDQFAGEVVRAAFRAWVRLVRPGQPDPPPTPKAMLWKNFDGSVSVGDDPLPDVPFAAAEVPGE